MEIRTRVRRALPILTAALLATSAVAWATGLFGTSDSFGPERATANELAPFDSCGELLGYVRDHRWAREPVIYDMAISEEMAFSADSAALSARTSAVPASTADSIGPSEAGTNVQEAGIDEPDIAKLSGETLLVVDRGELRSIDASEDEPIVLDDVGLPAGSGGEPQLLVAGTRAIVIQDVPDRPGRESVTRLTEVDIADPTAMEAVREIEIEGAQVSARLQGETAHVVVESSPDYGRASDASEWLPTVTDTDLVSGERSTEPLVTCDAVSYPKRFAGLGLLTVATLDLSDGLAMSDLDTVMTDAATIYASASSLYVATGTMSPPEEIGAVDRLAMLLGRDVAPPMPSFPDETTIHRFGTADPSATSYSASGRVEGRILNEWSFSEHDGYLRVATTKGDPWSVGEGESVSAITVLAEGDGELEQVGKVGGLGRGEEIHGVRFIGETGYVVTFEQTDPLYTVDLSSPESPRTTGELKIPGYSAYLHPVGEGRLLGIGQAGTQSGALTGAQASLFDVADAEAPARLATLDLSDGYGTATAEWDHHAFLFSPERALAVVPVESYARRAFTGAVAMRVDPEGGLTELGRFDSGGRAIERMFVVGERLVTLSGGEVSSRAIASFG